MLAGVAYLLIIIRKWHPTFWVVLPVIASLGGLATYNAVSYGHFGTQALGGLSIYGVIAHRTETMENTPLANVSSDIQSRMAPFAAEIEAADFP